MSYKPVNNVYVTDISGNNITIVSGSLQVVADITQPTWVGSNLKTGAFSPAPSNSGGGILAASGEVIHGISIKNVSGAVNASIHVGSSGNPPWISGGYVLDIGDEREFKVFNPALVRIFARTSGAQVCWAGVNF